MEYSSAIKEWPLLFSETRKTAILLLIGKSDTEIIDMSNNENIYQLSKEIRRTKLPQKILVRLHSLNDEQITLLANGNETIARLVCLVAILKTDKLLFEFMRDVYAEKLATGQAQISDRDFILYFEQKTSESPKVAKWSTNNLEQIKNAYKRILIEAGVAKKQGGELLIDKAICDKDELVLISKGNEMFADTLFHK